MSLTIKLAILKKHSIINKIKINFFYSIGFFFIVSYVNAQMQNNGPLYVATGTTVYLKTGNFSFGPSAATTTFRTTPVGSLAIAPGATTSIGTTTQFVDGWVSTFGNTSFTFPIGQTVGPTKYYAPAKVIPIIGTTGISASYFRDNTTSVGQSATLDASLSAVAAIGYWKVTGSDAALTLTWNSVSSITGLTTFQLADITIAGFNSTTSKWEAISSLVDSTSILGGSSSIASGSVTSTSTVTLANYSGFSIGLRGMICPELTYTGGVAITWNGTSWSATPTLADSVTISSVTPNSPGSFVCNSLNLGTNNLVLTGTQSIEVVIGITGSGKIIMSSQSSLVQRATGVAKPNIELTKATRLMHQYDYVYWSAPIVENAFSQFALAQASTGITADAFEMKFKYVSGTGGGWQPLTATEIGKGFIGRVKAQAPFTTSIATDFINFKFTGTANNGDITVPITQNPSNPNGGTSHNLLGNPYPSALDADKFLQGNKNIDGVIYIWKQQTPSNGSMVAYGQADYIAYTRAGSTSSSNVTNTSFSGKIASGQGFMVKALGTGPSVTFTNCMRLTINNTDFNKSAIETPVIDRYKVNLTGGANIFSQIVISYLPECTLDYDRMYDAGRNSVSSAQLYSILESDGRKLAINARPSFENTDVVPLGVSKTGTVLENFNLSIQEREGIFASSATPIYVHDILLNTYTDLTLSDYAFSSDLSLANDRFEIVYQNPVLNNFDFETIKATAFIDNEVVTISTFVKMAGVEIFDISGRKIITLNASGLTAISSGFVFSKGIYIAKIKFENGVSATRKLINK